MIEDLKGVFGKVSVPQWKKLQGVAGNRLPQNNAGVPMHPGYGSPAFDEVAAGLALQGIESLLHLCGDDPTRNGLQETPFRVVKAFMEYTQGYLLDPDELLGKSFDVTYDELVLIKDIPFNSLCEHHLAPFTGVAHVAYIPQNNVITGLSKFARVVDAYAQRFQVQERLTAQVADTIERVLEPLAVAVVIEAEHYCMCGRGVKKKGAMTVTSSMRGAFRDNAEARAEVLSLIRS